MKSGERSGGSSKQPDIQHDIELLRLWAARTPIVKRVWLFGSRICGDYRHDSDLDVAVEHGVAPGDSDLFTTGLMEPSAWRNQLQPQARLRLDIQSYIPGDTLVVEAGVRKCSRLIFERSH